MQYQEFLALQRVERLHWFYRGKRALVRWWIDRLLPKDLSGRTIVDAGAGTGELVSELRRELSSTGAEVVGIEYLDVARIIAQELTGVELIAGSILELPLTDRSVISSIALDVLEHVEDDVRALSELIRVTESGGIVIVNVPASMLLWSEWDVGLGHYRRYTMASFRTVLDACSKDVEIVYCAYINSLVFPGVLAYRWLTKWQLFESRAEDMIPPSWLNSLLYSAFVGMAHWTWFHPPFGVSIFCVLRKK